jgi:hypothetical protein
MLPQFGQRTAEVAHPAHISSAAVNMSSLVVASIDRESERERVVDGGFDVLVLEMNVQRSY